MKSYSVVVIAVFALCAFSTGCGTQSADRAATSGQGASSQPASGQAMARKPTPEQDAAVKRAIARGPAIAAANIAATHPTGSNPKK